MRSHRFLFIIIIVVFTVSQALGQYCTVGVMDVQQGVSPGYVLFTQLGGATTWLIDTEGRVVHSWTDDTNPGQMAYLHENGYMYRLSITKTPTRFNGGNGGAGQVECLSWEGDMVWSFEYRTDEHCMHHDICPMPNGNVLLIAWEYVSHDEAVALGKDTAGFSTDIWPDKVVEISPDGNGSATVVWQWRVWDHLVQDRDPSLPNYGVISEHPERIDINAPIHVGGWILPEDWLHCNGVKYNADLDQIVISSRHADEFWIIDHSTTMAEAAGSTGGKYGRGGDLLYRWGNPQMYGRGSSADRKLFGQHDPEWIPEGYPGEGNILIFNNGELLEDKDREYSSVDELALPILPDGSYALESALPYGPDAPVWSFEGKPKDSFFGRFMSGANRLPNGNTMMCNAMTGEFIETTPSGNIVWRYINPDTPDGPLTQGDTAKNNMVFKMRKYTPDHPAFTGRDLTPGATIELYPNAVDDTPAQSNTFGIVAAYPNPFRSALRLQLAESYEPVQLVVYNTNGEAVATLYNAPVAAPGQGVTWNGMDSAGKPAPVGVYHIVVYSATGISSRRVVRW